MPHHTSDTRIAGYEPLLAPAALLAELPMGADRETTVEQGRAGHPPRAGPGRRPPAGGRRPLLGARPGRGARLRPPAGRDRRSLRDDLLIVMRVYFEKPRTAPGGRA